MEYVVRVRDSDNHVSWEHKYNNLKAARKARKWQEQDHGYAVSIEEVI